MSPSARDKIEIAPTPPKAILADTKDEHDAALETSDDDEEVTYPDGGLEAWLVVLGSFCGMLACYGYMNSISTYNTYLSTHQLSPHSTSSVGWIFSVYIFLTFLCGIFIGPVFDARGPRALVFAGSVLMVASVMLIGICTEYWQFLVAFGLLGGIGTSLVVTPATTAIGHFFMAKRGYATGIACTGGSVGGVVFPLMLEALFPKGWAWATRIQGFVFLALLTVANLLIRSRLERIANTKVFILPNFAIFRQPPFALVTAAAYFLEWGLFVPVTYLTSYCVDSGAFSPTFAYQVIAIYNGASTLGRWASGYLADRFGAYNVMIVMVFFCISTCIALWFPAAILSDEAFSADRTEYTSIISGLTVSYAVLMGIASGSNISLAPVCVSKLCDTRQYGEYYGMCYTVVAFGTLTGVPIAGAIIGDERAYWAGAMFCGLCYFCALVCFVAIRVAKVGRGWRARY